jgi:stage II sporulation protein D
MKRVLPILSILASLAVFPGCPTPPSPGGYSPPGTSPDGSTAVRIGLREKVRSVVIESSKEMTVRIGANVMKGHAFTVIAGARELTVTGTGGRSRGARFVCSSTSSIRVAGKGYRGQIEVFISGGRLTVVNIVDLEDYLRGVVPREIGYLKRSEIEAMKAQAIAARTYTLALLGRRETHGFDLYFDTRDQVYGGVSAESRLANEAIKATKGQVLVYNGKLIEAYFHSTCGGSTVNIEDVWNTTESVPYLRKVYDGDKRGIHCKASPHFRWSEVYTANTARRIISKNLRKVVPGAPTDIGRLINVAVTEQSRSGRALKTRITAERGAWDIPKDKIRLVVRRSRKGNLPLRSSYVRLYCERDRAGFVKKMAISGGGFGHGIGMCQSGAIGMARKGYKVEQILTHYYTGTKIIDYRSAGVATAARIPTEG